jgi:RND family efflux transporter MFP subunit
LPIFALVLSLSLAACSKRADDEKAESAVPEVTVTKVRKGEIAASLLVTGNLAALPNHDAKIAPLVPGRIARVSVVEGDRVAAGQELAELDSTLLREQEHQAEAAVAQAQASLNNTRIAEQREESLLGRGISSRKEVEDARTAAAVAEATLKQAQAVLATAKAQLERAIVRAPFAGTVVRRFVNAGEQVDGTAAQPVVEVADVNQLELLGTVPATRLGDIRTGEKFEFESSAASGKLTAVVASVLPAVDPATNNGTVRIRIENPSGALKLGEFLSVDLPLKQRGPRLVLPRTAVYPDENGAPHVYKLSGDTTEFEPVEVGVQTKDEVEILSGVNEGDTVVLAGGYGLPEKAKVRIRQ